MERYSGAKHKSFATLELVQEWCSQNNPTLG
nr:RNase H1/viroplasmin domain-containing protein [Pseudomonas viridiflava]